MGKVYEEITDRLAAFIEEQHVFFVATAPKNAGGLINISPKGYNSFRILGPKRVAYLDMTGSGVETIAHVKENSRLTVMFSVPSKGPPKFCGSMATHGSTSAVTKAMKRCSQSFPSSPALAR